MKIVVVGLGYVGLPLAVQLAKNFETTGLDSNAGRIAELKTGHDRTGDGRFLAGAFSYADLAAFQVVEGLDYAFPRSMQRLRGEMPKLLALRDRLRRR